MVYAQACKERKFKPDPPKSLQNHLVDYIKAFRQLSTCRSIGMGLGPIPWTAVDQYTQRYEIKDEDYFLFVYYMSALDGVFLEKSRKK